MKLHNLILENDAELSENAALTKFMGKLFDGVTDLTVAGLKTKNAKLADDFVQIVASKSIRGVKNADDLVYQISRKKLTKEAQADLMVGFMKTSGVSDDYVRQIVPQWVDDPRFIESWANNPKQKFTRNNLLNHGYSPTAADELLIAAKRSNAFQSTKNGITNVPKPKPNTGAGAASSGGMTAAVKKGFAKMGDIMKRVAAGWKWAKIVAWAAGLGITAYALWYLINEYGKGEKPSDMPSEAPSDWSPCIQNMVDSGEATLVNASGSKAVRVVNNEYPDGLYFYSNGRVFNFLTKQKGSWTCKDGQTELQEVKRMSLMSLVEQTNEVSGEEMDKFLDDAVDDLDGFVAVYNINSLINIVKNLKGKKYKGQDAFQYFLDLYVADEGGDNFIDDVNSIGVRTLGFEGIEGKKELIALINGKSSSTSTPSGSGGFDDVNITWDQPAPTDGSGEAKVPSPGGSGVQYFSCEDWDINTKPYIMGCKATKIREIQSCLGLNPDGMFGPRTRKALMNVVSNVGRGISGEMYNDIMKRCKRGGETPQKPVTPPSEQPSQTTQPTQGTQPITKDGKPTTDTTQQQFGDQTYSNTQETGEQFYMRLLNGGYLFGSTDKNRIKFKYFDLSQEDFDKLNQFLSTKGYNLMKEKEKGDEKTKYVWEKSRR